MTEPGYTLTSAAERSSDRSNARTSAEESPGGLSVAKHVRPLGAVDAETFVETHCGADIFVMPLAGEGFPEAMMSGTPAIGLAVCGTGDALDDGELGTVSETENLAAALSRTLGAPRHDRQRLSSTHCARFERTTFVARLTAAFERLGEGM